MPAHNVISFIFESAWAITEQSLESIITIANRENHDYDPETFVKNEGIFKTAGAPLDGSSRVWLRESVAVIPVIGPIFPRANLFTEVSGAVSVQSLTADFQLALADDDVKSILLYVDSPGGQVTGVQEFANLIYRSRELKPIKGYIYGQGASAAYNIVSATSEIISAETSIVGSIGVLSAVKDTREREKREGVRTVEFVSSVSPNKTIDFENSKSLEKVQRMVDSLGKVMVKNIARFRGVSSETVLQKYGQGDVFVGQSALERGMIDRIGTFESLITELNSITFTKGDRSMDLETLKSQHSDIYQAVLAMGRQEAEASLTGQLEAARGEGAVAERERIQNIMSLKVPGAQAIVEKLMFDPKATKESVGLAILEDQQSKFEAAKAGLQADATALAEQTKEITTGQSDATALAAQAKAEEEAIMQAMITGTNKK